MSVRQALEARLTASWYGGRAPALWMRWLSPVYAAGLGLREWSYRIGLRSSGHPGVPVIIVGNLTVGGTGKTPLARWLGRTLQADGWRPGFVSRGYGGSQGRQVHRLEVDDQAEDVGDEPMLLARSGLPVWVGQDRLAAARAAAAAGCDVIVSDDGLQHRRLERDLELVVIDADRRLGNRLLLPAGPLREPESRLEEVDFVVINGDSAAGMRLAPRGLFKVADGTQGPTPGSLSNESVHAVAGIGNPDRFFDTLEGELKIPVNRRSFPDHHRFSAADLKSLRDQCVIMTEKDAVKCRSFAGDRWYWLAVEPELAPSLAEAIASRVAALRESGHG